MKRTLLVLALAVGVIGAAVVLARRPWDEPPYLLGVGLLNQPPEAVGGRAFRFRQAEPGEAGRLWERDVAELVLVPPRS